MTREPRRLSVAETAGFHLNYLAPLVTRGAIVAKPRGLRLISRLHPDPIGKHFFNQLRSSNNTTAFLLRTNNGSLLNFDKSVVILDQGLLEMVLDRDAQLYGTSRLNRRVFDRFLPNSLIQSDKPRRESLRSFVEERLQTGSPTGSNHVQASALLAIVAQEIEVMSRQRTLRWADFSSLAAHLATRSVFGPGCTDDFCEVLTSKLNQMVLAATGVPGKRSSSQAEYTGLLDKLVRQNSGEGLAGDFRDEIEVAAQAGFWLMALKDAVDTHLPRTLALIASHPEIHAELIREINGTDVSQAASIDRLTGVENAVHETLRLWSGTPLFNRECLADSLLGDFQMSKGVQVYLPVAYLCRDPVIYGEDAERFNPDRWLSSRSTFMLHFGRGPRRCAGRDIALFIMKAAIAHLLRRNQYQLHSPDIPRNSPIAPLYNHFRLQLDRV